MLATGEKVRKRTTEPVEGLTTHEALIARLAAEGRTDSEIGAELFVSRRTVEWHVGNVLSKLGVSSRRQLPAALAGVPRAWLPSVRTPHVGRTRYAGPTQCVEPLSLGGDAIPALWAS